MLVWGFVLQFLNSTSQQSCLTHSFAFSWYVKHQHVLCRRLLVSLSSCLHLNNYIRFPHFNSAVFNLGKHLPPGLLAYEGQITRGGELSLSCFKRSMPGFPLHTKNWSLEYFSQLSSSALHSRMSRSGPRRKQKVQSGFSSPTSALLPQNNLGLG